MTLLSARTSAQQLDKPTVQLLAQLGQRCSLAGCSVIASARLVWLIYSASPVILYLLVFNFGAKATSHRHKMFQAKSLSRKRKQSGHVFHRHSFLLALAMVAMLLAHVPNAANAEAIDGPETKSLQNMKPALAPGSYDLKTAHSSSVKAVPSPSPSFARTADLGKATKKHSDFVDLAAAALVGIQNPTSRTPAGGNDSRSQKRAPIPKQIPFLEEQEASNGGPKAPKVNQVRDSQRVSKRGDPTSSVQQQKNGQDSPLRAGAARKTTDNNRAAASIVTSIDTATNTAEEASHDDAALQPHSRDPLNTDDPKTNSVSAAPPDAVTTITTSAPRKFRIL